MADRVKCPKCDGLGSVKSAYRDLPKRITCWRCHGTGKVPKPRAAPPSGEERAP